MSTDTLRAAADCPGCNGAGTVRAMIAAAPTAPDAPGGAE
jgi:hypothetical protein